MKDREKKDPAGGILADDMGIGKTIETLATIMASYEQGKPTLIVCPVACVMNWKREITTKLKVVPKVHIYHGPNKATSHKDLAKYLF
jgi:SNF2 family DNA or RNA helicase